MKIAIIGAGISGIIAAKTAAQNNLKTLRGGWENGYTSL